MRNITRFFRAGPLSLRRVANLAYWDNCPRSMVARLGIVAIGFSVFFCFIAYRLVSIAFIQPHAKSGGFVHHTPRKEIVDCNGDILAVNIPASSLFANPQHMINIPKDIERLAQAIPGIDAKKLLSELKRDKTFAWIKRDLSPLEQKTINDLGIAGFYFEKEDRRLYTRGNLFSHIIGYVGRENVGLAGIEKYYDNLLTNKELRSPEERAKPLKLTIDARVQNIVAEELTKIMEEFHAPSGVGVVVNPNNGEIIALVSMPDFNPHHPSKATPDQLFNNATLGVFEMGSVMKTLTMAIGFDTDTITTRDAYNLSSFRVANKQLKDTHPMAGWHSVAEIFLHSSNIGVAQIALESGQAAFQSYYKKLGLFDKLQLELPECGTPLKPRDKEWSDITLTTASYGYAMSISVLHFIQAVIPVINGGIMHPLTLVKSDKDEKQEGVKVFKESTSDSILKIMRLVVTHGTGKKANVPGQLVAGKTGTAELLEGKHYVKNARRSSFLGVVPAINPQYVVYVMLNKPVPSKNSYGFAGGGWNATPAVGNIIARLTALYGMPSYDENDPKVLEKLHVEHQINAET